MQFSTGLQKTKDNRLKGTYFGKTIDVIGKYSSKLLSDGKTSAVCYIEPLKNQTRITLYQQVKN